MRCTSCNKPLKPEEIVWKPELNNHEPFCASCLLLTETEAYDIVPYWEEGEPHSEA